MKRRTAYQFTCTYNKTFISGNLKGITVKIAYGTCDPHSLPDGTVLKDCITGDYSKVSSFQVVRNF